VRLLANRRLDSRARGAMPSTSARRVTSAARLSGASLSRFCRRHFTAGRSGACTLHRALPIDTDKVELKTGWLEPNISHTRANWARPRAMPV
jgi:hypothetical protein